MGVILWYQIQFPDLKINVSSDVYSGDYLVDAEITVGYAIGQPASFEVRFKDLPLKVNQALEGGFGSKTGVDGGVKIVIRLGYLDDPSSRKEVLSGRIEAIQDARRFPPLGALLSGHEEASFLLLNLTNIYGEDPKPVLAHVSEPRAEGGQPVSPADVANAIVKNANVGLVGKVTPETPKLDKLNEEAEDAFHLLDKVAARFGAEVLVQDGKAMFGTAIKYPPDSGLPSIPNPAKILALITGGDSLIAIKDLDSAQLAEFKPVQIGSTSRQGLIKGVVSDVPKQPDVKAFDFTTLGVPTLRAGQTVIASVKGYENPFSPFRILQVTHSFSPQTGYTCTGRAVTFKDGTGNRELSELARKGSPLAIADRIAGKIRDSTTSFPSIDVGKVKAAKAAERVASLNYRQEQSNAVSSPSVDLDIPDGQSVLLSKPMASPFAWHKVGLSVPVYEGMRALLNQVRDSRDDAVVTGFLWANEPKMDRPEAHDGDWWLCLPTELAGSPKLPSGNGANDLTAADGRRVIEVAGLKIVVGKAKCSAVGKRPTEGDADVFLISHASGTTVQIDSSGNVMVDGAQQQVVLKAGGATLTVGQGKVAIS